ncbi:hypothetical protein FOL47_006958 [Perkinsus chesapeaki]|uniref:Uncharacterized protein n=1 Tax=Perkinsus chesapeaki TaxID=330153 RepID=A0A7J6N284_PERCH|nr:hypothetical protein FOL47_006958 [Perkinsus chesapeaki]
MTDEVQQQRSARLQELLGFDLELIQYLEDGELQDLLKGRVLKERLEVRQLIRLVRGDKGDSGSNSQDSHVATIDGQSQGDGVLSTSGKAHPLSSTANSSINSSGSGTDSSRSRLRETVQKEIKTKGYKLWEGISDERSCLDYRSSVMDIVADLEPDCRDGTDDGDWLEYYVMQYSLTEDIWRSIRQGAVTTPSILWERLFEHHQSGLSLSTCFEQWVFTKQASEPMKDFVSRHDSLLRQMATLSFKVPDEIRIAVLRNNLKDETLRDMIADELARDPKIGYAAVRRLVLTRATFESSNGKNNNNKTNGTSAPSKTTTGKSTSSGTTQSTKGSDTNKKNGICFRFLKGRCTHGDDCWFQHINVDLKKLTATSSEPETSITTPEKKEVKPQSSAAKGLVVREKSSQMTPLSFVPLLSRFNLLCLLDSGSQHSMISRSAADYLPKEYVRFKLNEPLEFYAANAQTFHGTECVRLPLFGQTTPFLVVDKLPTGIEALAGTDVTDKLVIDYPAGIARHVNGTVEKLLRLPDVPLYYLDSQPQDIVTGDAQSTTFSVLANVNAVGDAVDRRSGKTTTSWPEMHIIRDDGWLRIGVVPAEIDDSKMEFIAEVGPEVVEAAKRLKPRPLRHHKKMLQADDSVKAEVKVILDDFLDKGKLEIIPPEKSSLYPMTTTSNLYPTMQDRRNLLPNAFCPIDCASRYKRCVYVPTDRHVDQIIPTQVRCKGETPMVPDIAVNDQLLPLPDNPLALLDSSWPTSVEENSAGEAKNFMDDLSLFLKLVDLKLASVVISNVNTVGEKYSLHFKPSKVQVVNDREDSHTLGINFNDYGIFITADPAKWKKFHEKSAMDSDEVPLFKRQILLRDERSRSLHISVKELMALVYAAKMMRTLELYIGHKLFFTLRCDNRTAIKVAKTHRVSGGLHQDHYLPILNHWKLLEPVEVEYIPTDQNRADELTRCDVLNEALKTYFTIFQSGTNEDEKGVSAVMTRAQKRARAFGNIEDDDEGEERQPEQYRTHNEDPSIEENDDNSEGEVSEHSDVEDTADSECLTEPNGEEVNHAAAVQTDDTSIPSTTPKVLALDTQRRRILNVLDDKSDEEEDGRRRVTDDTGILQRQICSFFHHFAHDGIMATYLRVTLHYVWPHVRQDCATIVASCEKCQKYKTSPGDLQLKAKAGLRRQATRPFERVAMDEVGPWIVTNRNQRLFILTLVDEYSSFLCTIASEKSFTSRQVVEFLAQISSLFGVTISEVTSDNGSIFKACVEKLPKNSFMDSTQWTFSPIRAPQFNGLIERQHKDLNLRIRLLAEERRLDIGATTFSPLDWCTLVADATQVCNSRPRRCKLSPHQVLLTYDPPNPLDGTVHMRCANNNDDWTAMREKQSMDMAARLPVSSSSNASLYPGQAVWVRIPKEKRTKRSAQYEGPLVLTTRRGNNSWELDDGSVRSSRDLKAVIRSELPLSDDFDDSGSEDSLNEASDSD